MKDNLGRKRTVQGIQYISVYDNSMRCARCQAQEVCSKVSNECIEICWIKYKPKLK